jgi:transposase
MKSIAYVGIDAHKASHTVCVLPKGCNQPFLRDTCVNDKMVIQDLFGNLAERYELRCCYEASSCGYTLYRWLTQIGVSCEVIAPSLTPTRPGEHVKTDKRDALKLAKLYGAGQLTPIRVPSEQEESVRGLTRLREAFVRDVTESKCLLNQFLRDHGRVFPGGESRWTQSYWKWLRQQTFTDMDNFVFTQQLNILELKLASLKEVEGRVNEVAQAQPYKDKVRMLCILRGVAVVTAMTLITEIIDFRRFSSAGAMMSYLGLVPRETSSGQRQSRSGITKAGNAHCRRVLVESAWKYIRKPNLGPALKARQSGLPGDLIAHSWKAQHRLYSKYWSIQNKKEKGKAIVAVARELAGFVWAIMNWPKPTTTTTPG